MANILLVEDDELSYELASELLGRANHTVSWAKDGERCFEALNLDKPDLILMDIGLPLEDGLSLTKKIKANTATRDIPIVAFSAMVMPKDKEQAFLAGCEGFIPKPIEVSSFVSRVESYIKDKHKSHNLLVVDDNIMNAEIIKDTMESLKQKVTIANNGKQALEIIEREKFDLILLDIMMPDMSGFDIIKHLKVNPKTANLPVVFVSALDSTDNIVKGFNLGSYEYIVKPFKIAELKARILNILKIKDLQDELAAEKKILDIVFDYSADGIALLNSEKNIISCNEKLLKWLGKERWQVINKNFCEILSCNKEKCFFEQELFKGYFEFKLSTENSKKRLLGVSCSEVLSSLNEVEGCVLVLRDITAYKEIEAQKETFVAMLTHDLKTPVRAQTQALKMLLDEKFGKLNQAQAEIISETLNSNKYMASMLDTLLTAYKYENGNITLNKIQIDLNEIIKSCCNELKYLAEEKNQNIIYDFKSQVCPLFADPIEIKRVFQNLLYNAISYSLEDSEILITISNSAYSVMVSFKDNGKGISEEEIKTIFDKYTSHAKKFRQVGTGLGLYLAKHIVEMHGGEISVKSEPGKGSCFTVSLPL